MRFLLSAILMLCMLLNGQAFAQDSQTTTKVKATDTPNAEVTTTEVKTTDTSSPQVTNTELKTTSASTSNVERNKHAAKLWYEEVIVKKNPQPLDTILDDNVVVEFAPTFKSPITGNNRLQGKDQVKQHVTKINQQADFSGPVVYLIGEGDQVALYRVVTQKNPDGKTTDVPWASFFEFSPEGKIKKMTHVHDTLAAQMIAANDNQPKATL